ncbi:hypothetical protein SAY86_026637 [Trapa natans]|uniref:Small ribosomal subunit protein uS17c n=1 Tax=Trapa natans TaxID=22666 RepID=A0AAN7KM32_TRANT|nr:hypothetical protein SAY86_026637 [Trapa natans]
MLLTSPLLHPLRSLNLSSATATPFLHGGPAANAVPSFAAVHPRPAVPAQHAPSFLPTIRAMRLMQGRVVCATSDKTVAVEVVRLAPHPKYKRRVRKKKKYQAHDPDNQFKVGDFVQLEKCRPISKTKTFLARSVPARGAKKSQGDGDGTGELGIPLESQQQKQEGA